MAFAEAIVIAVVSLWIVRQGVRLRVGAPLAAVIAMTMAVPLHTPTSARRSHFFGSTVSTAESWDLVDASVVNGGGPHGARVLIAPSLTQMKQLNPSVYDYWDFYLNEKLHRPVCVIGQLTDFRGLSPDLRAGPVFAFVCRYFPEVKAGVFAFGPLDVNVWTDQGQFARPPRPSGLRSGLPIANLKLLPHRKRSVQAGS